MKKYIYCLKHPVTLDVFYVGQAKDIYARLSTHLYGCEKRSTLKDLVLRELKKNGLSPLLEVLEEIDLSDGVNNNFVEEREGFWITHFQECGKISNINGNDSAKNINKIIDECLDSKTKIKVCLKCGKDFISKRDRGIFCSDKCRVSYNRNKIITTEPVSDPNDDPITLEQMQVLHDAVLGLVNKIYLVAPVTPSSFDGSKVKSFVADEFGQVGRTDENLKGANKKLGSVLDEPKLSVQDEYFAAFDNCEYQTEVEIVATRLRDDKRLEGWQKTPLIAYGKKRYDKL